MEDRSPKECFLYKLHFIQVMLGIHNKKYLNHTISLFNGNFLICLGCQSVMLKWQKNWFCTISTLFSLSSVEPSKQDDHYTTFSSKYVFNTGFLSQKYVNIPQKSSVIPTQRRNYLADFKWQSIDAQVQSNWIFVSACRQSAASDLTTFFHFLLLQSLTGWCL